MMEWVPQSKGKPKGLWGLHQTKRKGKGGKHLWNNNSDSVSEQAASRQRTLCETVLSGEAYYMFEYSLGDLDHYFGQCKTNTYVALDR